MSISFKKTTKGKQRSKLLLKILAGVVAVIILLFISLSWYVSSHKKELLQKAAAEAGKMIGGDVSIADVSVSFFKNFPNLAIQFKQIDVRDSMYAKHRQSLFHAENLYVRVNTLKLLVGSIKINKIEIDSGGIYLFNDSSGYSNAYLLHPKNKQQPVSPDNGAVDLLKKIEIHHFSVVQSDIQADKLFNLYINDMNIDMKVENNEYLINVKEDIQIHAMAFKQSMGTYMENHRLEGNFKVKFLPEKQILQFNDIPVTISKQPFQLTGLFKLGKEQEFSLHASTKNMAVDFGKSILTKKTAQGIGIVTLSSPVDVTADITGSLLSNGDPLVIAKWATKNNTVVTPLISFSNCSFSGMYTNEVTKGLPKQDPNSKVEVYDFKGDWRGLVMTANKIVISNLTTPTIEADLKSDFQLKTLNDILLSNALSLTDGSGSLHINFKGPVDHLTPQNAMLNGVLTMKKGTILMHAANSYLTNCNASIRFANADVFLDTLNCSIQGNPIFFTGNAKNVLALVGPSNGSMSLLLNIKAPVLNINNLSSVISRKFPAKKTTQLQGSSLTQSAQRIDNLLSSGNISLNFSAGKLVYRKFEAQKVNAAVLIDAQSWQLKKAFFKHGSGSMSVSGTVSERSNSHFGLDAVVTMTDLDAQKIWYQFENFGIKAIDSKNIRGNLSTNAHVSLMLDKAGNFDMNTLAGDADFSIKNGALIDFKPLTEINKAIKSRDFTNISFAEIKDKITFAKSSLTIDRMEINSTVLSLFVEGVYGLSPGSPTDISIQVPLSNLEKIDKDYKPENLGTNRKGGMSVFLRAQTAKDGTIKVTYDPFKRLRKK